MNLKRRPVDPAGSARCVCGHVKDGHSTLPIYSRRADPVCVGGGGPYGTPGYGKPCPCSGFTPAGRAGTAP